MISSVNRIILINIIVALSCLWGVAKDTYCYKLIESSDANIKAGGYQFISIVGDQCYESDREGVSVKNGNLTKNAYQSDGFKIVFNGKSFCGTDSKFAFSSDMSKLTVTSKSNKRYKFVKTVAPQNVKTSSYLCSGSNSTQRGSQYDGSFQNNYVMPSEDPGYSPENLNHVSNQNNKKSSSATTFKCHYCNGKGRLTKNDNAPSNFGIEKTKKQCSECGEWYNPNVYNHYHINCSHCHGSGYTH